MINFHKSVVIYWSIDSKVLPIGLFWFYRIFGVKTFHSVDLRNNRAFVSLIISKHNGVQNDKKH